MQCLAVSTGDLSMSKENITALELSAMNDEKIRDAKREANRRFRERRNARMAEDQEYAELIKARRREYRRRYEEKLTAERADSIQRSRNAYRYSLRGKMQNIYGQRVRRAREKGLPFDDFESWFSSLPPRPEDTDLWTWNLKAIDPGKGVTAGNYHWVKALKPGALDSKLGDFNLGLACRGKSAKKRLVKVAHEEDRETIKDLGRSRAATSRQTKAYIDHEANIGRFLGYSLRIIGVEYRYTSCRAGYPQAFYTLRCSVCGAVFSRQAYRVLGTKSRAPHDACPHCQSSAKKAVRRAKNSNYFEFKEKLKNITVREDVLKNSHSDYGIRNRDMDFCEYCIDADLLGYGDTLREIYAI
jgi:hypothetical protein